ncbi:MAG: hypothetical protein OXC62_04905 [Aestuariivita sp.]|nr:hypothetical protein [Aestuariivita sp.]
MIDSTLFLVFLATLLLLEITPGSDKMLVLARGISQGHRVTLYSVSGMIFVVRVAQVGF